MLAQLLMKRAHWLQTARQELAEGGPQKQLQWQQVVAQSLLDLRNAIQLQPSLAEAHILLAQLHTIQGGNLQTALASAEEAVKLSPQLPAALLTHAALQIANNSPETALEDVQQVLKNSPNHAKAYEVQGIAFNLLKRADEAQTSFAKALELNPRQITTLMHLSRLDVSRKDFPTALNHLNQLLAIDPTYAPALLLRADLQANAKQISETLADLSTVLRYQPHNLTVHQMRVKYLKHVEQLDAFIDELEKQRTQVSATRQTALLFELAMLYHSQPNAEKAVACFTEVLSLAPQDALARRYRADNYVQLNQLAEAAADYQTAVTTMPQDIGLLNNYAWLLCTAPEDKLRNGKRALEMAELACRASQYSDAAQLSTLAAAYAELGDFDKALEWIGKALEKSPDSLKAQLEKEKASYQEKKPWRTEPAP